MPQVICIHEYELKPEVRAEDFERAVREAEEKKLLDLPGLCAHYFVKGIKGTRQQKYAMIWMYENQEAWQSLWGAVENPKPPTAYPANWLVWENDILAPFLQGDPDQIRFTAYEEVR